MDTILLSRKFEEIGARVQLRPVINNIYRREKPLITRRVKRVKDRLRRRNKAFVRQRSQIFLCSGGATCL
jgi:hypothetical protein